MLTQTFIFVINNVLAAVAAEAIVATLFAEAEEWRKWLARCTTFILLISGNLLVTGTLGLLKPPYVLALTSVFTLLSLIASKAHQMTSLLAGSSSRRKPTVEEHVQRLLAGVFFTLFAGGLLVRRAYQAPKWFNDDFAYHATNVVQWIYDGGLTLGSFNDHAYWPLNTALFPLWLTLPFHADGMVVWNATPWLILFTIALIGIARTQNLDWSVGLMAATMTFASPPNAWMLSTFSAADFSGPAMLLVAIAFLAPIETQGDRATTLQTQTAWASRMNVIYAGLASGFAVGTKVPFVLAALVIGLWILLEQSIALAERLRRAVLFALGVATTGSYWYIRNWIITGNPLFPGKAGPFDGPMTFENSQATLFQWMMRPPLPSAWKDFFKAYVGSWSYGLAFLALIALGFAIQRCIKTRSGSILVPLIATFLTLLLTHPFMPVSGPYPVDSAHPHFVPRYITGVFLIGMALTTILLGAQGRTKWIWWACAAVASVAAWSGSAKGLVLTMVAATLLFGLSYFLFYALARSSGLSWRSALVAIGSCVAAALLPYTQQTVDRYVFDGYTDVPVGTGWRALEALPSGSRIAWFDNYKWEYYPMYGRRWQLAPVPVRSDGTSFRPVHYDWRYPPPELSSGPELLKNLLRAGVQYVFVSKNRGDVWPAQYNQLDRLEGVTKVYNDGYSAIFRIS